MECTKSCLTKCLGPALCVIAGALLVWHWADDGAKFDDVLGLAIGLYFIGKGIFIKQLLSYQQKLLEK